MKVWVPNNKNRLKKTVLGSVPTPAVLEKDLGRQIPEFIKQVLIETQEDLDQIKKTYEDLDVEVLTYPVKNYSDGKTGSLNVRNGFIVVDDHLYVTDRLESLEPFYELVPDKTFVPYQGTYCPNIFVNNQYVILDRLSMESYHYWRRILSPNRKIITAFNEGHSDGIYCNVADKLWLTNGDVLPFKEYWPNMPVMDLSTTNNGVVNHWEPVEKMFVQTELDKTAGRYLVDKHTLEPADIKFIDEYLDKWIGYCDETLFDINMSVIDENNVMVISQNSLVYERLESLGIKVHQVPFRHRMFWDGGLHCITNDLERERS